MKIITILSIYAFVVAYVLLFSLLTEWNGDAIAYSFYIPLEGGDECHIPISNLKDIWESQLNHYKIWNGRFIVHFFVQLFCGILGRTIFSIFNAMMWVLLIREITKLAPGNRSDIKILSSSTLLSILLFGSLSFTPPFAINYVWVAYIILVWLRHFFAEGSNSKMGMTACGLLSLMAGQLHEGFSVPICGALLIWLNLSKWKISKRQWVMGILFAIGSIVLIAAPGNFVRLDETKIGENSILKIFEQLIYVLIFPGIYGIIHLFREPSYRTGKYDEKDVPGGTIPDSMLKSLIILSLIFCLALRNVGRGLVVYNLGFVVLSLQYIARHKLYNDIYIILILFALATGGWNACTTFIQNKKTKTIIAEYESSPSGKIYMDDRLFLFNQVETLQRCNTYTNLIRSRQNPNKPFLKIYPESLRGIDLEKDTNMVIPIGHHSSVCVQSISHPMRFIVRKTIKFGPIKKELTPRTLEFDSISEIFLDSTASTRIVIYSNRHPQIRASVDIES